MGNELSFVAEVTPQAGQQCRIYRETRGGYVVQVGECRPGPGGERLAPGHRRVATLASAYATCQELRGPDSASGASGPALR